MKFRFKKIITILFVLTANLALVFPADVALTIVKESLKDSKVVDIMYWALQDSKVIDNFLDTKLVEQVKADPPPNGFYLQTGKFVGNAAPKSITGLGFSPDLVILKPDTTAGSGAIFKTKAMSILNVSYFVATAQTTTGAIRLDEDGFTASTTTSNNANVTTSWVAIGGSDCTASGVFCIGAYTGNGAGARTIDTGFQPDLVWVKRSTAVAGSWRTSDMATNESQYFQATTQDTTGTNFTTFSSTGFTVGPTNNVSTGIYYFVAFKQVAGALDVGTYTGNATDNRNITGVGFKPDFVFLKNANAGTAVSGMFNINESYGDSSNYFTDTANLVNSIQALQSDGFQVGTDNTANGSGNTIYYAAFGGAAAYSNGSGTFKAASGSYTGTGQNEVIQNLDFMPDLVIIKGNTTQSGVFRTSLMSSDSTAYLDAATANFAGGIISINPDGFTVGTSATVNTTGLTYYWTAYGNAWIADKNSGSSDFFVGAYYGNSIDNRSITRLPFQPDMVTVKRNRASAGAWRSSIHSGDSSSFFAATADASNVIQSFNSDGFQIGTSASTNTAASVYFYFGFKTGTNFAVGSYSGTGITQNITSVGFQPDNLWVKAATAVRGVQKNAELTGNTALPFINVASIANAITGVLSNGFSIGTAAETNTSAVTYRYVAWNNNFNTLTPTYTMQTGYYIGNGAVKTITNLGFSPDLVIIKSDTNVTSPVFKTKQMISSSTSYFIATADATTGIIRLDPDGFTVSTSVGVASNNRYTWIAFDGSDCSSSGQFCTSAYIGNGGGTRAISNVGFQPDIAIVKQSTAVAANWRSSSMPSNTAQYFINTNQETTGALFASLDATGYTVGTTNNASAGIYYSISFKSTSGAINVGTFTGNGTDNRNITGVGFRPDFVLIKNANATTAVAGVFNLNESYGDNSGFFTASANTFNSIQELQSDGFQVGNDNTANGNTNTMYYAAFGVAVALNPGSGTFQMASGSYTGVGNYMQVSGLGFQPDLIIIKGNTTQSGVFRTSSMAADSTAYLDSATANFAGGIIAIHTDSFVVGTSPTVNSTGLTYYWTAYGNAWTSEKNSGSADFFVGGYYGNGIDNRNISRIPFQPDMVTVKRSGATGGAWRSSTHSGDTSSFFAATANTSNVIQAINSDGYQIGTAANVNTAANIYWHFGFDAGPNFTVGNYSGTGSANNITSVGFQPDNLWVKSTGAVRGVQRMTNLTGDAAIPFINVASITGAITGVLSNGFSVGTAAETNSVGTNNYFYAAWNVPAITLASTGTQVATINKPITDTHVGAAFTLASNGANINLNNITISETGTVNANTNLANVKLYYETAGTCTYDGIETQYGSTQSFNASQQATFANTLSIGTSQVCMYVVLDVGSGASAGETIEIEVTQSTDIEADRAVLGTFPVTLAGTSTISSGNVAPNNPASLLQARTDDSPISTGAWINQSSVKFSATVSDTDNPDTLYLCVELQPVSTPFTGTETACGSSVNYVGTPLTATVTISSLTENEYKWQASVKDSAGAYSAWVTYSNSPTGLVGYWKMDESSWTNDCSTFTALDSSANSLNARSCPNTSGPNTNAAGQYGRAGEFDGADDRIEVPYNSVLSLGNNMTLEAWIRPDSVAIDWQSIMNKGSTSDWSARSYGLMLNYGNVHISYLNGNGWQSFATTTSPITAGVWTHVAYTRDGTTEKIYVNGSQVLSQTITENIADDTFPLTIGGVAQGGSGVEKFDGLLDEVKIYSVARNLSEVNADMNATSDRNFGIDLSAPTGGTVFDGVTIGVDSTFNNGSLSTLSANWSGIDSTLAGLQGYEYSIGTTPGGTDILTWTSIGTSTSITNSSLTLQSSVLYYVNIRTTDFAGNTAVISSNGQMILPALSFTLSTTSIVFDNLNNGNSFTDTKSTTLTTSTNAYNGYIIQLYKTDNLRSILYPSETISDFSAGSYAAPAEWGPANYGFGYTSSDTTIQGINKFNPVTCAGGGSSPCYAPISSSAPGDIVADHTTTVTGSPITNEQFDITYQIKVPQTQIASPYTTTLVYTIVPQY